MDGIKLTIVYYSSYGTNHAMATTAAEAAEEAGAQVRLRRARETAPDEVVQGQEAWAAHLAATRDIPEAAPEDMAWADAYLFSAPTRYGNAASQMRAFIDTLGPLWQEGKLENKLASAMTSAQNVHGGQETTLHTFYTTFMHWGCLLVPPGYTSDAVGQAGGNPYGVSVTAGDDGVDGAVKAAIRHQVTRLVKLAERFHGAGAGAAT